MLPEQCKKVFKKQRRYSQELQLTRWYSAAFCGGG